MDIARQHTAHGDTETWKFTISRNHCFQYRKSIIVFCRAIFDLFMEESDIYSRSPFKIESPSHQYTVDHRFHAAVGSYEPFSRYQLVTTSALLLFAIMRCWIEMNTQDHGTNPWHLRLSCQLPFPSRVPLIFRVRTIPHRSVLMIIQSRLEFPSQS